MSEIARCPICSRNPCWDDFNIAAKIPNGERAYYCCGVRVATAVLWNQYAAAMHAQKELDALREAVAYHLELADQHDMEYLGTQDKTTGLLGRVIAARAEVDRLIANETAADCKGEG